jgi:hypothetical protein
MKVAVANLKEGYGMDTMMRQVLGAFLQGVARRLGSELTSKAVNAVNVPKPTGKPTSVPVSYLGTVFVDPWGNQLFRNLGQVWFSLSQPGVPIQPPPAAMPTSHLYMDQNGFWYAQTSSGWFVYTSLGGWHPLA